MLVPGLIVRPCGQLNTSTMMGRAFILTRAQNGLDIVEMRGSRRPRLDDLDHSEILRVEAVEKIGSSFCFAL